MIGYARPPGALLAVRVGSAATVAGRGAAEAYAADGATNWPAEFFTEAMDRLEALASE